MKQGGGLYHLRSFLNYTLPILQPAEFVAVTGDLTDAKDRWKLTSKQFEDEWKAYRETLKEFGIINSVTDSSKYWIDMRGNHDCFDVSSFEAEENFYKSYSVSQKHGALHVFEKSFGKYTVVALDAW
jgi:hypothetical protein